MSTKVGFKLTVRAKGAEVEFSEGLGAGVLATQEVWFILNDDQLADPNVSEKLALELDKYKRALIDDVILVEAEYC